MNKPTESDTSGGQTLDSVPATELPWTLTEREIEQFEAYIAEHGLAAMLDHLGLDGQGNRVAALVEAAQGAIGWAESEEFVLGHSLIWADDLRAGLSKLHGEEAAR